MHTHDENGEVRSNYFAPDPIFSALLRKYDPSGKVLKWKITVKPSGTISTLDSASSGIHVQVSSNRNGPKSLDWNKVWSELLFRELWEDF